MFPVDVEMNPADLLVLKEIENGLLTFGFKFVQAGPDIISITGIPSGSYTDDPVLLLEILIEEYKNTLSDPSKGMKERVAGAMAAATAIPYGRVLLKNEMEDLFDTLFACKSPNYSPKGKPVINILTLEEIDQRLK
jgi:DNA mismatch repair protein MutL